MKQSLLTFLFLLLPVLVSADPVKIDGIYYNIIDDNNAEVTRNPNKYSGDIIIPETMEYEGTKYSVTSIDNWAFSDCSGLTSIIIPKSMTSIGRYAFSGCFSLTSITIRSSYCSIIYSVVVQWRRLLHSD